MCVALPAALQNPQKKHAPGIGEHVFGLFHLTLMKKHEELSQITTIPLPNLGGSGAVSSEKALVQRSVRSKEGRGRVGRGAGGGERRGGVGKIGDGEGSFDKIM